jgi:flagellar FliL protein
MAAKAKKAAETEAEADAEEGAEGASAPTKRKLSIKLVVMVAAGLLVVGGGGAGGYVWYARHAGEARPASATAKPAVFVDMPEVLVNLANTGNDRTQYLKIKVVLELPDQALMQQIQPIMPRVMDTFQTYLRELRPTDLEGSAGLYRLKEELTRRVNAAISPSHINAVLFKEIVVQ